jgi:hypothetical protein
MITSQAIASFTFDGVKLALIRVGEFVITPFIKENQ